VTTRGAEALLGGLVDYAGLFPPAGLGMAEAVAEYQTHRAGEAAFMLGRFVVPAARLDELEEKGEGHWPAKAGSGTASAGSAEAKPWPLTALVGPALEAHAEAVLDFVARHTGQARIDAVELSARSVAEIEAALAVLPVGMLTYVEVPLEGDLDPLLAVLRERRARAKVRTGGVVPEAIPDPPSLARFIGACARARVAFKATAGLHHPVRAVHPLTYEKDAPRARMHGFLNVFAAAALAGAGTESAELEAVIGEEDPTAFRLDESGLAWRERRLDVAAVSAMRRDLAHSFGSCSFREPVTGLRALGMIA